MSIALHTANVALALSCLLSAASRAPDIHIEVTRLDGKTVSGRLTASHEPAQITLRTQIREESFAVNDVMSVRFQAPPSSRSPSRVWPVTVTLSNGSQIPAEIVQGGTSTIRLKTAFAENVLCPIDQIARIRFNHHAKNAKYEEALEQTSLTQDVLLALKDTQIRRFDGALEALQDDGGSFRIRDKTVRFRAEQTYALILAGTHPAESEAALCRLHDGSLVAGRLVQLDTEQMVLQWIGDQSVKIPVVNIAEIVFTSDRVVYLSDLDPAKVNSENVFDVPWRARMDRSVLNRPLSMAGRTYAKGIGVHAASRISYELDGDYRTLAATIGIDDSVRPAGSVVFVVLADDSREIYRSPVLTGHDDPLDMSVSLHHIKRLTLIVEPAQGLDIGDHANWALLRLIR